MSETAKKRRRRWRWVVLAGAAILLGWPVAWRSGPLNTVERKVLGAWERGTRAAPTFGVEREELQFTADRRFLRRYFLEQGGTFNRDGYWHAEGRKLYLIERQTLWQSLRDRYRGRSLATPTIREFEILETDPPTLGPDPPPWQRVKTHR